MKLRLSPSLLPFFALPFVAWCYADPNMPDGNWQGKLHCGEHRTTKAKPYSQEVSLISKAGRLSGTVLAVWPQGRDRIEWSGGIGAEKLTLVGLGNRIDTTMNWETRLVGTFVSGSTALTLSGQTYFQGATIRDCRMELVRAKEDAPRSERLTARDSEKPSGGKQD